MNLRLDSKRHISLSMSAAAAFVAFSSVLLLAGCGGGTSGGGSTVNGNGSGTGANYQASLADDVASLNALIASGTTPTTQQLTTVAGNLKADYLADPTNSTAATAYAIAESSLDGVNFSAEYGPTVENAFAAPAAHAAAVKAKALTISSAGELLTIWDVPKVLTQSGAPNLPVTDFVPVTPLQIGAKADNSNPPAQVQANFATLDADLANVEAALGTAIIDSAQPGYSYTIPDPGQPNTTYKIGTAELEVLDASLEVVRSLLNVSLIYSADNSNWQDQNTLVTTEFAAQLATVGSTISPAALQPSSPFLTLTSDGDERASNVKTELTDASQNAEHAITNYGARNNAGYLLGLASASITPTQLDNVRTQIQQYSQYLSNSETISVELNGQSSNVTINVGAILNNPPANLYQFLPTLTVGANSVLYVGPNGFADDTFGGLFPQGIPINSSSNEGINGYTESVNSSTTVQDLGYYDLDYFVDTLFDY